MSSILSQQSSLICETAGATGNDYEAGEINMMVDVLGYGLSVSNAGTSSGGLDEEDDDSFKERIQAAPESFSIAGPTTAYEELVKTVSTKIMDVAVYTDSPLEESGKRNDDKIPEAIRRSWPPPICAGRYYCSLGSDGSGRSYILFQDGRMCRRSPSGCRTLRTDNVQYRTSPCAAGDAVCLRI